MYGLRVINRKYIYHSRLLPGQQFKRHADESYIRNDEEASYYTFLLYLNDNYSGGETVFDSVSVSGERGLLLIFLHSLGHEGAAVASGRKYVLRTDIMYRLCSRSNKNE